MFCKLPLKTLTTVCKRAKSGDGSPLADGSCERLKVESGLLTLRKWMSGDVYLVVCICALSLNNLYVDVAKSIHIQLSSSSSPLKTLFSSPTSLSSSLPEASSRTSCQAPISPPSLPSPSPANPGKSKPILTSSPSLSRGLLLPMPKSSAWRSLKQPSPPA